MLLLTCAGSALVGYAAASSAIAICTSNTFAAFFAAGDDASYDGTSIDPICTTVGPPGVAAWFPYGTPRFTSAAFATSQGDVNFDLPTGSHWTEQVAGSAITRTGDCDCARSSA